MTLNSIDYGFTPVYLSIKYCCHRGGLVLAVRSGGSLGRLLAAFPGLFSYVVAIE